MDTRRGPDANSQGLFLSLVRGLPQRRALSSVSTRVVLPDVLVRVVHVGGAV